MNYKEKVIALLNSKELSQEQKEGLEKIFPELKESEDERIKKAIKLMYSFLPNKPKYIGDVSVEDMFAWLEKQGEQKSVNEHKFNIGDWITRGEHYTYKIIAVGQGLYVVNKNNEEEVSLTFKYIEKYFHLWTIQDAKAGDILSYNDGHGNDCIELIKSVKDKKIEFWFCLSNGNRYEVFDGIVPYTNFASREDATPATKEQCDLLFQKMREAGFEWDSENLELKKIEQKPWSEEDEDYRLTVNVVVDDYFEDGYAKELCDWLKSFKDRYTWKPSDEQMDVIEAVINNRSFQRRHLNSLYEQLKKLKGE